MGAAALVGVLHTIVPDHWAPIAIVARQRRWSRSRTAWAAAGAGLGHTLSTIAVGLVAFVAGAIAARHLGREINLASGIALIGFGAWATIAGIREQRAAPAGPQGSADALPSRTALMLILGSSPSIEMVPTFLAAAPRGLGAFWLLGAVFGVATVGTYVLTCVLSVAGLARLRFAAFERYGEIASGIIVMIVGVVFTFWFR